MKYFVVKREKDSSLNEFEFVTFPIPMHQKSILLEEDAVRGCAKLHSQVVLVSRRSQVRIPLKLTESFFPVFPYLS